MKRNLILICATLLLSFWLVEIKAQEAVYTSGGSASGTDGFINYSVGTMVHAIEIEPDDDTDKSLNLAVSDNKDKELNNNIDIKVYPNPVTEFLTIKAENLKKFNLQYQLYNLNGTLILSGYIINENDCIDLQNIESANYLLKILSNNMVIKTINILKTKKS